MGLATRIADVVKGPRVRTPTVLQMEAVECGAAALGIILAHYGLWVPLERLRVTTGVSRNGAKASNVVKAARGYGMTARGLRLETEEALALEAPFVVFWNFNHFVVVEGSTKKKVFLNDPATGPRTVTREEFDQSYTGVVLEMRPGPDFQTGGQRRDLFQALSARLDGSRGALLYVSLVTLMLVVPGLLLPAFLKNFIDYVLTRGDNTWILPILVGLGLSALLSGVLTYFQQHYLLRVRTKLAISSASQFFWHVLRVPVVFYTQRHVGDVASRVQACQRLAQLLSGPLTTSLANGLLIVFFLPIMALYSLELTVIAVVAAILNVAALRLVRRRLRDFNSRLLNQRGKLAGAGMAGLQAIETLKATGSEHDFFATWTGYQNNTLNTQQELGATSAVISSVPKMLDTVTTGLILGVGGLLVISGNLTIGGLVAFQSLMGHFSGPVKQLVNFGAQLQQIGGDLDRLDDVERHRIDPLLQAETRWDQAEGDASRPAPRRLSGRVEMRDVSFGFSPLDDPFIDGFNLSVEPGQRIALVGPSGSGKSTLGKLLLGLYQPTSGAVLFDDVPLTEIPRDSFTGSVASVDQEINMFAGTILENLTMWDPTVPESEVVAAAEDACIHEVIAGRPGGYRSEISEGQTNFSGGQAQRLEIARALVRDPKVLVLDEATSALEPLTEKLIDDNIRRRGCSAIIIAHRLSTIRDCDEIIVLDRGQILERGTHSELMANQGRYAELVSLQ